jgi:hypothetical protein
MDIDASPSRASVSMDKVARLFMDVDASPSRASISIHKVLRFYAAGLACRRVWTAPTAALVGGFGTPPVTAAQRGVPPWESLGSKLGTATT